MLKKILLSVSGLLLISAASTQAQPAQPTQPTIQTQILLKTSSSWDGTPYTRYPDGQPELTVRKVIMPPGTRFDWHQHPMPAAGYVVSGELTVEALEGGKTLKLTAGQVLPEMNNIVHRGTSGNTPTELIVFYAGTPGMPLSVEHAR